jgi:predicted O-methyltransferase YrrM
MTVSTPAVPVAKALGQVRQAAFEMCAANRVDQACQLLGEALRLQPGHAELLCDLAALHLRAGRHAQSIQAAREALLADPDHDESAYALASALAATGQADEAGRLFQALAHGERAARFARTQPELAARCRTNASLRSAAPAPVAIQPAPAAAATAGVQASAQASTRFSGLGVDKYQLDHLTQKADQNVGGPIQDDEALALYALVRVMRLRRVLEIGGLSGYSARNFLAALGDETDAAVYTVDINPVTPQAPNHFVLTKDCGKVQSDELHRKPLDLIFFDAHVLEPQMALLARLERDGLLQPHTVIALHDTNLHPRKTAPWSYPITDSDGSTGYVHQAVERQMVNRLRAMGWDALCLHFGKDRGDDRLPIRHGLTLMQRFRTLAT